MTARVSGEFLGFTAAAAGNLSSKLVSSSSTGNIILPCRANCFPSHKLRKKTAKIGNEMIIFFQLQSVHFSFLRFTSMVCLRFADERETSKLYKTCFWFLALFSECCEGIIWWKSQSGRLITHQETFTKQI